VRVESEASKKPAAFKSRSDATKKWSVDFAAVTRVIPVWLARASFGKVFAHLYRGCPRRLGEFF
jgi:hypothetical protein